MWLILCHPDISFSVPRFLFHSSRVSFGNSDGLTIVLLLHCYCTWDSIVVDSGHCYGTLDSVVLDSGQFYCTLDSIVLDSGQC